MPVLFGHIVRMRFKNHTVRFPQMGTDSMQRGDANDLASPRDYLLFCMAGTVHGAMITIAAAGGLSSLFLPNQIPDDQGYNHK